ncbi:MAG: UDP-N-acetylglucosamine 4,6-dehydratase [Lachnospiraceae bacterium]|nr:UDP-N-acetylglucosamine 4,6-dehydratase [Lachnospiraceae bacterium]
MYDNILPLIGRTKTLFVDDLGKIEVQISDIVKNGRFLVIGGAGTIGSAICRELFARDPKVLHVVDISENNMVELVRDIRSSKGYGSGEFATFAIDCGSDIFKAFIKEQKDRIGGYDYVFNTSALKHVRSEKDPYTLMRMIDTNIFNTDSTMLLAKECGAKKYFCVSTDKAANPVNMMGASKRIMEHYLNRRSLEMPVSTARFANVAFSDGSLLYGFNRRLEKEQPIAAPNDVRRYFVTPKEAGELCILSCLTGENRDIYFPKLDEELNLVTFSDIAVKYLNSLGYEPVECATEDEARARVAELKAQHKYPVYFFKSDTTGEKDFEEFYMDGENLDMEKFTSIGIVKKAAEYKEEDLEYFTSTIRAMREKGSWTRGELVELFNKMLPEFHHKETGKFLDSRM